MTLRHPVFSEKELTRENTHTERESERERVEERERRERMEGGGEGKRERLRERAREEEREKERERERTRARERERKCARASIYETWRETDKRGIKRGNSLRQKYWRVLPTSFVPGHLICGKTINRQHSVHTKKSVNEKQKHTP